MLPCGVLGVELSRPVSGRFPSNILIAGDSVVFPKGRSAYAGNPAKALYRNSLVQKMPNTPQEKCLVIWGLEHPGQSYADSGSAARFFKQVSLGFTIPGFLGQVPK